jgi:hypothetical protein
MGRPKKVPNALATVVRQLPAVTALGEIWQQRITDGETDEQYMAFLGWLDLGSTRGTPTPEHMALANRHEWATRALAFERADAIQRDANTGGVQKTPEQQIVDNLIRMVQIEAHKLLTSAQKEPGAVTSLKDLLSTVSLMADLQKAGIQSASAKIDWQKMTTEEIEIVLNAQKILRRVQGK